MSAPAPSIHDRAHTLGPSDFAAALGLSKYTTPLDLYLEKIGEREREPAGEAAYWGTILEEILAAEFTRRTGQAVRRRRAPYQHPFIPWMRGHVDRILTGTGEVLECKTASAYLASDWAEGPPLYYLPQVVGYMLLADAPRCHVAALIGGQKFVTHVVERDPGLEAEMVRQLAAFWRCVETRTPPEPRTPADWAALYPKDDGEALIADPLTGAAVERLQGIKTRLKALEEDKAEAEEAIKAALADKALLIGEGGKKLASWKTQTARRLDQKALKTDEPALYTRFIRETETRVFRTYP